jgi:hypothetical protein
MVPIRVAPDSLERSIRDGVYRKLAMSSAVRVDIFVVNR